MKTEDFRLWLSACKCFKAHVVSSRVSNCSRVAKFYANLDALHAEGLFDELIEEFRYSTEDERLKRPMRHKVPIGGNIRNGSATLRSALAWPPTDLVAQRQDRYQTRRARPERATLQGLRA